MSSNTNLNFVNYDFDVLVQQMINRLKNTNTWKDTYRSATGQMLIEMFSYVGNLMLYYVERRAEESYIDTARFRSSLIRLVRLINYIPRRKTSSTGVLTFSINPAISKKVFIPRYTECQTVGGIKYLVSQDVVLLAGQTSIQATAIQGSLVDIEYTSTGEAKQSYTISDTSIENSNLFVYVNDVEWSPTSSFVTSTNNSTTYTITYELDDTITINFGDDINGKIPPTANTIRLRYIKSDGLDGNVYETDKIQTINSPIFDEDGNLVTLTVTNPDLFLGGDDVESDDSIRVEAPKVFATGDRAVTKDDFIAIIENYPSVTTANVWGENEENPPNYNYFNRVSIALILQNWQLPTTNFKQTLSEYLYTKSLITVKYEYVTPTIIYVIPTVTILKVQKGNTLSYIQDQTQTAIENEFVLGDTTKLGSSKRISDIIAKIDNIDGVAYHHMYYLLRKILQPAFDSYYDYGEILAPTNIKTNTIDLYIGATAVAIDDGAGNIIGTDTNYTITGIIDYTTGVISVNISPTPSDTVTVTYQQDSNGDIVISKNQICKLYSVDIQNISYDQ